MSIEYAYARWESCCTLHSLTAETSWMADTGTPETHFSEINRVLIGVVFTGEGEGALGALRFEARTTGQSANVQIQTVFRLHRRPISVTGMSDSSKINRRFQIDDHAPP